MKHFDVVLANPPFQDRTARGRTPHKLWIEFTEVALERLLAPGGLLLQISPSSFRSPSSKVLELMRTHDTQLIDFDAGRHFPQVGSSFAYYAIVNQPHRGTTEVTVDGATFPLELDEAVRWLPTDLSPAALAIHAKVMWATRPTLAVQHDYVTCHNTKLGRTLSKTATELHVHPVFHTNGQTWYSSIRQPWAAHPKVLWTRSGYTTPFYDPGTLGGTDMAYFVEVANETEGNHLVHNLGLPLIRYILATAKWSGFGNEIVFHGLPDLPRDKSLTEDQVCALFDLSEEEKRHVAAYLA